MINDKPIDTPQRCGLVNEGKELTVGCPQDTVVNEVIFASYGMPKGKCQSGFSKGIATARSRVQWKDKTAGCAGEVQVKCSENP